MKPVKWQVLRSHQLQSISTWPCIQDMSLPPTARSFLLTGKNYHYTPSAIITRMVQVLLQWRIVLKTKHSNYTVPCE